MRGSAGGAKHLVERRYTWRGYQLEDRSGGPETARHITLLATNDTDLFGTLTVGLDSRGGLQVDALYRDEIEVLRARQRALCEFTRLAVDPDHGSKDTLAALFHVAFLYASRIHHCDEILIEVNPRHVAFYQRMLGFVRAGPERMCLRVGAPAVLLRLRCTYASDQIARYGGQRGQGARSLYPYFLPPQEGEVVVQRAGLARSAAARLDTGADPLAPRLAA